MVRAAVTGAFDYTGSDPTNKQWRLRHRLMIAEFENQQVLTVLAAVHNHWCSFIARTTLSQEGIDNVKRFANEALQDIKQVTFPWIETAITTAAQRGTISEEDQRLVDRYKELKAQEDAKAKVANKQ
jgi:hypothetical protein